MTELEEKIEKILNDFDRTVRDFQGAFSEGPAGQILFEQFRQGMVKKLAALLEKRP